MKKILAVTPFTEEQKASLTAAAKEGGNEIVYAAPGDVTDEMLDSADALIGNLPVGRLHGRKNLTWVQLQSSGATEYALGDALPAETVLTSGTGAYGFAISENMVAWLLVMMKRIPAYLKNQEAAVWKDEGVVTTPAGKRILMVGTGNIASEFVKRISVFGPKIVGVRRRADRLPEGYDEIHPLTELKEEAAKADIIVLTLPGNDSTYHLVDEEILRSCKKGAYLINVGRGNVVDTSCFLNPEIMENFAGIWIDVAETEPLPDGDPLFAVPKLYITPHITGGFHLDKTLEIVYEISLHNLKVWQSGGEYKSVVDRTTGYCK